MTPHLQIIPAPATEAIDFRAVEQTLNPAQRDELRWLLFRRPNERERIRQIQAVVAIYYGIEVAQLTGRSRWEEIVWPRMASVYLAKLDLRCGCPRLARLIGRNEATVLNSVRQVSNRIETDKHKAGEIIELQTELRIGTEGK